MVRVYRLAVLVTLMLVPAVANAQIARDTSVDWLMSAGSEGERYLRTLQVAGLSPTTQWSIRPFSNSALASLASADSGHPWAAKFHAASARRMWIRPVAPEVGGIFNSTFPYGMNDGPVWAGRGLTIAASAGIEGAVGPLKFVLAPQFFRAQNVGFPLEPTGLSGPLTFADPRNPTFIDLPQRFGDGAYQRVDPGQSRLSLSLLHLTVGASTANEYWGPAMDSPYLLGNNAAGFEHLFLGTDGQQTLGPLRVGMRVIVGRLTQSDYSSASFENRRRSLAGVIVALGLRRIPNLEIGGARLFENNYPDSGVSLGDILRPLAHGLLKTQRARALGNQTGNEPDNQLASLFARWVFPESGVEVYGELGRDDNAYDTRDLILEPDHDLSYLIGLARTWKRRGGGLLSLHGELLNSRVSHLERVRSQAPPYYHTSVVQGHTQAGQLLGAPTGYGGGSTTVAMDWLSTTGRVSVTWRRVLREPPFLVTDTPDVMHSLSLDALLLGRRFDVMPEATLIYNGNRDGGSDAVDLRMSLVARRHW
jgi:hypothetical protein